MAQWHVSTRFRSDQLLSCNGSVIESISQLAGLRFHQRYHTWPSSLQPTPYEIMGIQKYEKYSKSRYYDLVKIYHPDRKASPVYEKLPKDERLARYRLIVDAHTILSDDRKRSAYDKHGRGWNLESRRRHFGNWTDLDAIYYGRSDERGHYDGEREFLQQLIGSKSFICLIVVIVTFAQTCALLSSVAKSERQMRQTDEHCRVLMDRRRERALNMRTLVAQMESFLLKRDPSGLGLLPTEEPLYHEFLPLCSYKD